MLRLAAACLATLCLAWGGPLVAAPPPAPGPPADAANDVLVRVGGPAEVAAGDQVGAVVVVSDRADVRGVVAHDLVVVGGEGVVSGEVRGDVVVVGGSLRLLDGARVGGDVDLYRSTLERAPGALVGGAIDHEPGMPLGAPPAWLVWLGATLGLVAVGLALAAVAGRLLGGAAQTLRSAPGGTAVATALLWVGLPVAAGLAFVSLIGIPVGLVAVLVVAPVLWLLGYLVAAASLGGALLRRQARPVGARPYREVALGVLVFQSIVLLPWAGGLLVWLAGLFGAGALVYRWYRLGRPEPAQSPPPPRPDERGEPLPAT